MITTVIKRDGKEEKFSKYRIQAAIEKAFDATDTEQSHRLIESISRKIENKDCTVATVEQIQDWVVKYLMKSPYTNVATAYVVYRNERDVIRRKGIMTTFDDIVNKNSTDVTRENGNMNADTPSGMMYKFASESSKEYTAAKLLSPRFWQAHKDGVIHIHDLDFYPTRSFTCLQHPLDKILREGFTAGHGHSRPAKRIETAAFLGCISMETCQNEQHGGQAIPAFDFYMAPYVRMSYVEEVARVEQLLGKDYSHLKTRKFKDYNYMDLGKFTIGIDEAEERIVQYCVNNTIARVHQAMESFIHNMNTIHSRGGNQVVFSSINYGTDTSAEGRCVMREILKSTYEGVGNGETAIFPIQVFKSKTGVSYKPEDPNYDLYQLACKVCAKRFYPNFINLDSTFNYSTEWDEKDPNRYIHEVATMGCRTRIFENINGPETSVGRGNLSFTTVNLPRLGIEAMQEFPKDEKKRISKFKRDLVEVCNLAVEQLRERYEFQKKATKTQFPLLMSGLWVGSENLNSNDTVESVINQGTLGLGFIGLAEALICLTGKHHGESDESQKLGLEIVRIMKGITDVATHVSSLNYSVFATPAEGLSGRFTRIDKAKYGVIPGVTDKEFYTNSNHVPVYYHCAASHKAEIECPYHELTRGGHIFYVEQDGDPSDNPEAIMRIVDMLHYNNGGYCSINYNANTCCDCGHQWAGKDSTCPSCGSTNIDTLQRITGYLIGTTKRWNKAKLAELEGRVAHEV